MSIGGIGAARYPTGYEPEKPEKNAGADDLTTTEDYLNVMREYRKKLFVKIKNGDTKTSYQIGSQSLTEKEWDELLEKFDLAMAAYNKNAGKKVAKRKEIQKDVEDVIQELQKAGTVSQEPQKAETAQEPQKTESISDVQMDMLFSDIVQARFPLQEVDEEGNPKNELYLVAIDKNGIRCSKAGSDEYEWQIVFTDESQYQKAAEFMDWADDRMDNFLFSAHENFWEDYLNGNMDTDAFQKFLEGTDNGIPNYTCTVGDSMYVDREKIQWAKYMNRPSLFTELSREELWQSVEEELENNKIMYGKTFEQMMKDTCAGWDTASFIFAGESKVYSFYEFVKEWENRYAAKAV